MDVAKLTRLEARTRVIRGASRVVCIIFGMALGFVVVATAVPQLREMEKLEVRLEQAREREREIMAERDQRRVELRALREDPRFLELKARDRLDLCRDGEKVLRFERDRGVR